LSIFSNNDGGDDDDDNNSNKMRNKIISNGDNNNNNGRKQWTKKPTEKEWRTLSYIAKVHRCCLSTLLFPMEYSIQRAVGARHSAYCITHNLRLVSVIAVLRRQK
jgi:hypothetical protein